MNKENLNVAFVGCGGFSTGTLVPNVMANPNLHIRAMNRRTESALQELKNKYKPDYVTPRYEEIFADDEVDMVICGTKPNFRLPIMETAVQHGKPLFVEKPLCFDDADIEPMVRLMRQRPVKFMVGFNRPYSPMMQAAKPLFQEHKGENTLIIYRIIGESDIWPQHHKDAVLDRKETTLIHETTHIFDLMNWLTDSVPTRIYAAGGGNVDNIITLTYPDNVFVTIVAGDNASVGYPKERFEINTGAGTIVGDHFLEMTVTGFGTLHYRKTFDYVLAKKTMNTDGRVAEEKLWEWRQSVTEEEKACGYYYERQLKPDKGHYGELEHFRRCIVEDKDPETDVIKGALAQLIARRAEDSINSGKAIDLDFAYLNEL